MKINDIEVKENSRYFILEEGDNFCRIVSEFAVTEEEFKSGPATRYCCYVIDREDGAIRIAKFGKQIFKQLQEYSKSRDYAFETIPSYDINVKRVGTGQMDTKYTVLPARADTPLTEDEERQVAELMPIDMAVSKESTPF